MRKFFLILGFGVLLSACSGSPLQAPVIQFIGVGTGTLTTNLQQIRFGQRFGVTDTNLIAAVAFQSIESGSTVQATWFSPDERRMPLGRTSIIIGSGAKIARFSFASREPWEPAPYLLRIDASTGEGDKALTASGSLPFFIGMTDDEIGAYMRDYEAWTKAEAEERAVWDQREQARKKLLDDAKASLGFKAISVAANTDVNGDGSPDYVVTDRDEPDMGPGGGGPGVIATAQFSQGAILNGSGRILLSLRIEGKGRTVRTGSSVLFTGIPKDGDVQLTILPSLTVSLSWRDGTKDCYAEFTPSGLKYALLRKGCHPSASSG